MSIKNKASISKTYKKCLLMCFVIAVLLCVAQVLGNMVILLGVFALFFLFILYSSLKKIAIPVLLFFLPWSPLLKLAPGQMSMYTIAIFAACLIAFMNNYHRMAMNYLVFPLLLIISTGLSKIISGYYIDNTYIMFSILLVLFPAMVYETENNYDFYIITIFFAGGIIFSALSSKQLYIYPTISRFIDVFSWKEMGITRYSGFYGDSNFYSAHVMPAIGGILLMFLRPIKKNRFIIALVSLAVLLYCGFIAASKSFIIITVAVTLVWFLTFLFVKNKISVKLIIIIAIALIVFIVFNSSLFSDTLEIIMIRFGQGLDADTLTTGRNELWTSYLNLFMTDSKVLFLGRGYTDINLAGRASHNTLIQMVYQFGLIGLIFFIGWLGIIFKKILKDIRFKLSHIPIMLLFFISSFGLWLSIDVLFIDDFFLIMFYYIFGLRLIARSDFDKKKDEMSKSKENGGTNEIHGYS